MLFVISRAWGKEKFFLYFFTEVKLTISLVLLVYLLLLKNFPSRKILRIRSHARTYTCTCPSMYAYETVIKGTSCTYNQEITG